MRLDEIRIIDLKSSKWDEAQSDPKEGKYVFTDKKYVNYKGAGRRPDYWWTWERFDPRNNYMDLDAAKWRGFVPVKKDDPDFQPDGVPPNAEGNYVYVDTILVKCALIDELRRRDSNVKDAQGQKKSVRNKFAQETDSAGAGLSQGEIDDMLRV